MTSRPGARPTRGRRARLEDQGPSQRHQAATRPPRGGADAVPRVGKSSDNATLATVRTREHAPAVSQGPKRGTGVNDAARRLAGRVRAASVGVSDCLVWRTSSDELRRAPINSASCDLGFEDSAPIRIEFRYQGRRAFSGEHWFSPTRRSLHYESMTERLSMILLAYHYNRDDMPDIVAAASQPMLIVGPYGRRYPDLMLRFDNGERVVIDVKTRHGLNIEQRARSERTQEVCDRVGWRYFAVVEPPAVIGYNLETLASRRQPWYRPTAELQAKAVDLCRQPRRLKDVADMLSPTSRGSISGNLLHLLWSRVLDPVTLTAPLDWDTVISDSAHTLEVH